MSLLKLQNIAKTYAQASRAISVLKNCNADIALGQTVSLLGQSGSGKSTLLSLMAGLDNPDSGKIFFKDLDECMKECLEAITNCCFDTLVFRQAPLRLGRVSVICKMLVSLPPKP